MKTMKQDTLKGTRKKTTGAGGWTVNVKPRNGQAFNFVCVNGFGLNISDLSFEF